jgi:hypothetical protein
MTTVPDGLPSIRMCFTNLLCISHPPAKPTPMDETEYRGFRPGGGRRIIAQDKSAAADAVLGQSSIEVSVPWGRREICTDALFNEINHLQPRRRVVSF